MKSGAVSQLNKKLLRGPGGGGEAGHIALAFGIAIGEQAAGDGGAWFFIHRMTWGWKLSTQYRPV